MRSVEIPMFKIGDDIGGLVLTENTLGSLLDSFYSSKEKVICYDVNNNQVGEVINLKIKDGVVWFSVSLKNENFQEAKPVIETFTKLVKVKVK